MNNIRNIIEINEDLCNGCGQCVLDCAEGAIQIIDGKARVISDNLCDGLGACLGGCPTGALKIIQREALPFDEDAVHAHLNHHSGQEKKKEKLACGCPGSLAQELKPFAPQASHTPPSGAPAPCGCSGSHPAQSSAGHWPVKLRLMPEHASFLQGAELLLAADCAPAVHPDFPALRQDKVTLLSCPKFEDTESLARKLEAMCRTQGLRALTVVRMEVPCCAGLARWVDDAVAKSGQDIRVNHICLGRDGRPLG